MNADTLRAILDAAGAREQPNEPVDAAVAEPISRRRGGVSVAFYTPTQLVVGLTDSGGQRLSDIVNNNHTSFVSLYDVATSDLLSDGEPRNLDELVVRKDVLHLVVPRDNPNVLRPQVATRRMGLEITTPFFRVRGALHRRESDPTNLVQIMSGYARQFLPLADVTIEYLLHGAIRTSAHVALFNTQHLQYWAVLRDSA